MTPHPPAPPLPSLDDAEAQAWRVLERRLRLLHGFGLLIYFVRTPLLVQRLRARLSAHLASQHRTLAVVATAHPDNFADLTLKALLGTPEPAGTGAHWLEAHRGAGQPDWDRERHLLLTRLNERRSRLEAEFHAPLILLVPAGTTADTATLAPDLWHIRLHTTELAAWMDVPAHDRAGSEPPPTAASDQTPVEPEVRRALQYWVDQWRSNFDEFSADDLRPNHPNLWAPSIWDGATAVKTCLQYGRIEQARIVALELVKLADLRCSVADDQQLTRCLRDLYACLYWQSQAAQIDGVLADAGEPAQRALDISRELARRLGGTPEALDDVGIALINNALLPDSAAHELLSEAATIYVSLVQRCPQVQRYADNLSWVRDKLAAVTTPDPDPRPDSK